MLAYRRQSHTTLLQLADYLCGRLFVSVHDPIIKTGALTPFCDECVCQAAEKCANDENRGENTSCGRRQVYVQSTIIADAVQPNEVFRSKYSI